MSSALTGWRPALRIARREAARSKARTALVVALIAIPVAAMVFAAVLLRTTNISEHQRDLLSLGQEADAIVWASGDAGAPPETSSTLGDLLPNDVRSAEVPTISGVRVRLGSKFQFVTVYTADTGDSLLKGVFDITKGRAPTNADETAVSTAAVRKHHVHIGDTVTMRRTNQEWKVVGVFERADSVNDTSILVRERPRGGFGSTAFVRYIKAPHDALLTLARLSAQGGPRPLILGAVRDPSLRPFPSDSRRVLVRTLSLYTAGTLGLFIVGIIVSAAFAVSARRQLRSLGLAGASGASPRQVRLTLVAQGFGAGVGGLLAGLCLAAFGVAFVAPHMNRIAGVRVPGIRVGPGDVVAIAGLALATAVVAALIPSISIGRTPVTVALAGRRPLRPARAHVPVVGAAAFALGLGVLATTVANWHSSLDQWFRYSLSGGLMLFGSVLSMPWLIGKLEPLAGRLRGSARLAARSMARNRPRTGPIAAAVLAAAGATMALATFHESSITHTLNAFTSDPTNEVDLSASPFEDSGAVGDPPSPSATAIDRVSAILKGATHFEQAQLGPPQGAEVLWPVPSAPTGSGVPVTIGAMFVAMTPSALEAAGVSAGEIAAFRTGSLIVSGSGFVHDGGVGFGISRDDHTIANSNLPVSTTIPAIETSVRLGYSGNVTRTVCDPACHQLDVAPTIVVPLSRVSDLHLEPHQSIVRWRLPSAITRQQQNELRALRDELSDETNAAAESGKDAVYNSIGFSDSPHVSRAIQAIVLGAMTVAALLVTAIGLALSAAEGRGDDTTLLALGAPPRVHRARRAWEALLTAGPACLLAVPLGFLPAAVAVMNRPQSQEGVPRETVAFPWRTALGLGVALPLVAAGVFWLLSRPRRAVLLRED